ncbi:hypothetical protein DACRYDRAFT_111074 [Dacryopinax primogenitus]|uniref:Crossover junction endonuclease MUS81 n=1 Tax=Dacryopinax primogenitus (strain DJM 731) TaxID=1858805 RepID=M5FX88_DACPD|nr:uncharacterized protein DACRYDRAFT_111074 [Dacryopinax primogenitus]EJT98091.1 hypothetical protein DACRYDRAFT_111074 [Dacryopinax primogenitus]
MSLNTRLANYLLEFRDQHDPDSNLYRTYNKAYNHMRRHGEPITSVEEAGHVFGVGKTILRMLTNRLENDGGTNASVPGPSRRAPRSSDPPDSLLNNRFYNPSMLDFLDELEVPLPACHSRGRGNGRGARGGVQARRGKGKRGRTDERGDEELVGGSPTKKRASGWSGGIPRNVRETVDDCALLEYMDPPHGVPSDSYPGLGFWYLDTDNTRVAHYEQAEIRIVAPFVLRKVELPIKSTLPPPVPPPFKLVYLEGQPLWTKPPSRVAWVEEELLLEKSWDTCPGFAEVLPTAPSLDPWAPTSTSSQVRNPVPDPGADAEDLASLLAQERRSNICTLDPSRTGRSRMGMAPQPMPPPSSIDGVEYMAEPLDARRAAAEAAEKWHQAAEIAKKAATHSCSSQTAKDKIPPRTTSAPITARPVPAATNLPPRAASASFFPQRRLSVAEIQFPVFRPIVIPANTYDILLLLDNREIGRYGNHDAIKDGLEKLGVQVEQRVLAVGDVVWLARSKMDGKECVLNWIVERKRLDDLCMSIKDSRFQDQKFRLSQSGLLHVFYLVEHFAAERLMRDHELLINTALSRTQVVDEFRVSETRSQQETVEFLANMHSAIRILMDGRALHVLPSSVISRATYVAFQAHLRKREPTIQYLPTWSDFQSLNTKNATRTVQETWARMLLCVKGLSAERTSKLLDHYGTPREIWEAYCRFTESGASHSGASGTSSDPVSKMRGKKHLSGPKTMLAELGGEGRRKIGNALSEKIWEVMMSKTYS